MRTIGLYGKKYVEIEHREIELPDVGDLNVLVKVHACGVCGTDLNFLRDWEGDAQPMGHELAGEVVEIGRKVENVRVGQHVIVEDCTYCGICPDCKLGRTELCRNMYDLQGRPGMSRYLLVNCRNLVPFDGMDYTTACLTEPLAVAMGAVLAADIPMGGSVMVLGHGPIGLMTAKMAMLRGAGFVGITGSSDAKPLGRHRLEVADKLGCGMILQSAKEDVSAKVRDRFPYGVDRVIVTSPPRSMYDAFKIVHFGGIIVFLGLDFGGGNVIDFDVNAAIFNKITLKSVFAEPAANFAATAELLKRGIVDASLFLTHSCNYVNVGNVLGDILKGSLPAVKVVFEPWR